MNAPLEVCERRDPKNLYKKARAGQIKQFTGIDAPYESPEEAEVVVHTDAQSEAESVARRSSMSFAAPAGRSSVKTFGGTRPRMLRFS